MQVVPGCAFREGVKGASVDDVNYDTHFLTIVLRLHLEPDPEDVFDTGVEVVHVVFTDPEGFRVLDEGHLLDLVGQYCKSEAPHGCVFELDRGGWRGSDTELQSIVVPEELREFFVPGWDDSVSVMAYSPPTVVGGERWLVPVAAP